MIGHFWLGNALGRAWHWIDDRVFGLRGTRQITAMRDGCNYYTNYICVCIGVCVCVVYTAYAGPSKYNNYAGNN